VGHVHDLSVGADQAATKSGNVAQWLRAARDRVLTWLLLPLFTRPGLWLLRTVCPILRVRLANFAVVTRYEHVDEVLRNDRVFHVEERRVRSLNGGPSFLLGLQDGEAYRRYQAQVMSVFRLQDIEQRIASFATRRANEILATAQPPFDAVRDLITRVPLDICRDYYGVAIPEQGDDRFARDTFLVSHWLFDPRESTRAEERRALELGVGINELVQKSVAAADATGDQARDTIITRLLALRRERPEIAPSHDEIRVIVVGMILGFVPTNTMAGGHILDVLLDRSEGMALAREAAAAGDLDRLERCLFEAMRFAPLLREPARICAEDYTIGDGTWCAKRIAKGTRVLPLTRSAMCDPRRVSNPRVFDPDRPAHHSMLFGHGLHRCIGEPIARAQITRMFEPLLLRSNLRRAPSRGKLDRKGTPFPYHLFVAFDSASPGRSESGSEAGQGAS
jgi:cytochrome P450